MDYFHTGEGLRRGTSVLLRFPVSSNLLAAVRKASFLSMIPGYIIGFVHKNPLPYPYGPGFSSENIP